MSYILDALKKADREREQGQVPGLHAQPAHAHEADVPTTPAGLSPLVWAGLGVALTLVGLLAWQAWPHRAPDSEVGTSAAPPLAQTDPRAAAAPLAPQPPTGRNAPPPMPTGAVQAAGSRRSDDGVRMQVDGTIERNGRGAQPVLSVPARDGGNGSPPSAATAVERDAAPSSTASVPKLSDMPESFRKELPALQVGGAMYSPNPAQRMLVLNGQVFHEGDHPENGLKLEEIRLKTAVMSYRGQRFELQY